MKTKLLLVVAAALAIAAVGRQIVLACPFCSVESQTLSEEIKGADAVVLAQLVKGGRRTLIRPIRIWEWPRLRSSSR